MTLEFITNPYQSTPGRVYRGFRLLFRFVKNFGITTGQKDPQYGESYVHFLHWLGMPLSELWFQFVDSFTIAL